MITKARVIYLIEYKMNDVVIDYKYIYYTEFERLRIIGFF